MNKSDTVVVGNLVDSPRMNRTASGSPVTNFRVASTRRRFDQQTQAWVDAHTLWLDVECFGELAGNVARSLVKGDPVVVTGDLYTNSWESETGPRQSPRLKADSVGPDLAKGWAAYHRLRRTEPEAGVPEEPAERSTDYDDEGVPPRDHSEPGDVREEAEVPAMA